MKSLMRQNPQQKATRCVPRVPTRSRTRHAPKSASSAGYRGLSLAWLGSLMRPKAVAACTQRHATLMHSCTHSELRKCRCEQRGTNHWREAHAAWQYSCTPPPASRAEGTSSRSNPEVATFTTLRPHSDGGYAPTEMGCSRRDYLEEEEEDEEFEPK